MTIVLARELERFGVRVNAIAPVALTRLTDDLMGQAPDDMKERLSPENTAAVVGFLASDLSAGISGQVFKITGGLSQVVAGWHPVSEIRSDKQWTIDTAVRIAAKLGMEERAAKAAYPINTDDAVAPFLAEINAAKGDIMMCGHVDYLLRSASRLVCGDEKKKVVEFKPGNGTVVCLEGKGDEWVVTWMWRQDHAAG